MKTVPKAGELVDNHLWARNGVQGLKQVEVMLQELSQLWQNQELCKGVQKRWSLHQVWRGD